MSKVRLSATTRRLLRENPNKGDTSFWRFLAETRVKAEVTLTRLGYISPSSVSFRLSVAARAFDARILASSDVREKLSLRRDLRVLEEYLRVLQCASDFYNWQCFQKEKK